ncbi:MAG: hypothetical protein ROO76_09030 [Terriglobia bacterium]|nr:hypothetical protein [Terriglobia bacterium]
MSRQLLETSQLDGWSATTAFGGPVFESHDQIAAILRRHLGAEHAALFAQPELANGQISWFTDTLGEVRPWRKLSVPERARLDPIRLQFGEQVKRLTSDLACSGANTPRGNLSHILSSALEIPGIEHLYAVGDQPVLAFWGFRAGEKLGYNGLGTLPSLPDINLSTRNVVRSPLGLMLLTALLALLLSALGWGLSRYWLHPKPSELAEVPRIVPITPPTVPNALPDQPAFTAALAEPQWRAHDLSIFDGCWAIGTDHPTVNVLGDGRTEHGTTRAGALCFNNAGYGSWMEAEEYPSGRFSCNAVVSAGFDGDRFVISKPQSSCTRPGVMWNSSVMSCTRNDDKSATCVATSGGESPVPMLFYRE